MWWERLRASDLLLKRISQISISERTMKSKFEVIRNVRYRFPDRSVPKATTPELVLRELFELLEDYGPTWYTKDIHDRAMAVLTHTSS